MRQTRIEFSSDGNPMDGVLCGPDELRLLSPAVVVCHPHPLLGGHMDVPVVVGLCRALADRGIVSMRFNFRRETSDGAGLLASAARDAASAFEVLRSWEYVNSHRIAMAGYSFGAVAILEHLRNFAASSAFAFIAPPASAARKMELGASGGPMLFVSGTHDKLVDIDELRTAVQRLESGVQLREIEGADHGFTQHTQQVAEATAEFLAEVLG